MSAIFEAAKNMLFPQKCKCCFKLADGENLCNICREKLAKSRIPYDKRELSLKPELVDKAYSSYYYDGAARDAVIGAKFVNPASFLNSFENDVKDDILRILSENDIDFIVATPPYKDKYFSQEYDLPTEMARKLSAKFDIENKLCIQKVRKTKEQHQLSKEERKANLVNAFEITENVNGKSVLLIDDVLTTGVTLSTIARELKLAGCEKVIAWTYTFNTY